MVGPVEFRTKVADLLSRRRRLRVEDASLVPSAVLLLFYEKDRRLHLLLTKRTDRVAHHKGQMSFPGGARDPADRSLLATALRESAEEIGLRTHSVEILGALDDTPTVASNYIITPYVGYLSSPPELTLCREEVDEVVELPLDALSDSDYPNNEFLVCDGGPQRVPGYRYDGHIIWGATARLISQFLDLMKGEAGAPVAGCAAHHSTLVLGADTPGMQSP